jgi:hypothetical protein
LFIPAGRRILEKTLSVVFIIIVICGVTMEKIGDNISSHISGPRHLTPEQERRMIEVLVKDPGHSVTIVSAAFDREAGDFADEFVEPFFVGNWRGATRVRN